MMMRKGPGIVMMLGTVRRNSRHVMVLRTARRFDGSRHALDGQSGY
ncbi:hypothetical protein [Noviherbaspirillum sp. Root189]|nr:hypothetical protein [Noviherbaspirillum sp. Root189]